VVRKTPLHFIVYRWVLILRVFSVECPPKWRLAVDVMAEIKQDFTAKQALRNSTNTGSSGLTAKERFHAASTAGRVLFIVKDGMALAQLRDVLVAGIDRVCDQRYRWFVSQQAAEIRSRTRKQHAQQQQQQQAKRSAGYKRGAGAGNYPCSLRVLSCI
jgi:hypothetical protein